MNEESFDIIGEWWLPETPNVKVSGALKFSIQSTYLELNGSFEPTQGLTTPSDREIIHGLGRKGEKITLNKCYFTQLEGNLGSANVTYVIQTFFVGSYFQNEDEIKFSKINVKFSKLNTWIQTHGFKSEIERPSTYVHKYTSPQNITVKIDEQLSFSIVFGFSTTIEHEPKKRRLMEQDVSINLFVDEELDLLKFWKIVHHLRHFISLGILAPENVAALIGFTNRFTHQVGQQQEMDEIKIYWSKGNSPNNSYVNLTNMMFSFEQIQNNFENYIKKWFELRETLGIVANLYFGTLYNPQSYINEKFFNIVASLESFHRIYRDDKTWSEEHFEQLKSTIGNAITDNEDREKIMGKIKYANELTLRNRLKQIINEYNFVLTSERGFDNSFIDLVVETRNYYAHYDLSLKNNIISNENLPIFINKLRIIVEICLLSQMGMEEEDIKTCVQKSMYQKNLR